MKNIVLVTLAIIPAFAHSQKSPIKFGDIPMEDMKMTVYNADSSATAVILADYGNAYVNISAVSANLMFERHVRIKILKKDGTRWADASLPVYNSGGTEERLTNLKAVTYNLIDGKIMESKMAKDAVFKEKFNRNINLQKFYST
jgi:hypothetical protein